MNSLAKKSVNLMPAQSLLLNFLPVELSGETTIRVGYRSYDKEILNDLRREFGETHIFKRNYDDDTITEIPVVTGAEILSDKIVEVDLAESWWFWKPLLNAALLRLFAGQRQIISDYPVTVLGNPKNNLIVDAELPEWVRILPLLEFEPRSVFGGKQGSQFGLVCNVRTRYQLLATCDRLLEDGLSPVGRYVQIDDDQRTPQVAPRGITVGRVASIEGEMLILDDHREGYESVSASNARLTGNRTDFDWCVNTLLPGRAESVLGRARAAVAALSQAPGRLERLTQTAVYLRNAGLEAVPGVRFDIGEWFSSADTRFPRTETIERPTLVFHPSGRPNDVWNERGIKEHGPHDQRTFTPKRLNIAVICQGRFEGQVDRFMAKFLDGIPEFQTQNGRKPYDDGFLRRFRLERANVQTFRAASPTRQQYEAACKTALKHAADQGFGWNLAIVQIEEDFKTLPGPENPYFATKAMLLRNNVAVQNVRIETMSEADQSLVYTMNQVSLASYAKLGGRPWLLSAQKSVAHELVIGIGSHTEQRSRFDRSTRYVGITTVFSSDGGYHLSERTGVVPFEDYGRELTETLTRTIERVRREDNWKNSDRVRLVFHAFKQIKDIEAEAIKDAVEALELENVVFAFVHVVEHHPFLIFDQNQEGLPNWERDRSKRRGVLSPSRGLHIKLGDFESLVVFAGANELKQADHGMPTACLLKLHRHSTFTDMTYLARQAFDFTAHSWRVMTPEPFPITIKYSDLIAERLAGLKQIDGWDDDAVRFRDIGRAPWFL